MKKDFDFVVELSKPYVCDGTEYTELDLSGMMEMTGKDFRTVEMVVASRRQNIVGAEQTITGACAIAAQATGLTIEFFEGLPMVDALAVRNKVLTFLA